MQKSNVMAWAIPMLFLTASCATVTGGAARNDGVDIGRSADHRAAAQIEPLSLKQADAVATEAPMVSGRSANSSVGSRTATLDKSLDADEMDPCDIAGAGEVESSLERLPAAARATALREAGEHGIVEVEEIRAGGATYYEAVWIDAATEFEVLIGADGDVLCRSSEPADDEQDEDDARDDD